MPHNLSAETVGSSQHPENGVLAHSRRTLSRLQALALAIAAAWLVPLVLHVAGFDLLVWPVLLVGTASVLRTGTTVLDRLVLAGAALVGATLTVGLLVSVWPWGLAPVPVGGTLLTLVALTSYVTRRRPALPRTVQWSDGVILGTGVISGIAAARPIISLSIPGRLNYSTSSLDRLAHFALYETIQRVGGYTFLNQVAARHSVQAPTEVVYPQGSHFMLALINSFSRAGAGPAPALADYDRYFIFVVGGFALLSMCTVWAARWMMGPRVTEGARVVACVVVAIFTVCGPLIDLIVNGADSELFGLIALVLAAAIAVRPAALAREQIVLACALTITVFYTYNLYGIIVGFALLLSLLLHRFPWRAELKFAAAVVVPSIAVAVYPSALSLADGFDVKSQVLTVGGLVPMPNELIPTIAAVVVICLLNARVRAERLWRGIAAQGVAVTSAVGLLGLYQLHSLGHTTYYFGKLVLAAYVVSIACLGVLGVVLGGRRETRPETSPLRQGFPVLARRLLVSGAVLVVAAFGLVQLNESKIPQGHAALRLDFPLRAWEHGSVRSPIARRVLSLERHGLLGDGVPTIVDYLPDINGDWRVTFFMASFNRDLGVMQPALADIREDTDGPGAAQRRLEALVKAIADTRVDVRVIVRTPALATALTDLLRTGPDRHVMIVAVPTLLV